MKSNALIPFLLLVSIKRVLRKINQIGKRSLMGKKINVQFVIPPNLWMISLFLKFFLFSPFIKTVKYPVIKE
jgi:hypothetical protein